MPGKSIHPSPEPQLDPGDGLTEKVVVLPDGRRIRTVVAGDAAGPLVVLEAGMSAPAASWVHTQRELSRHARTLSYDRAGYGGSDVDPADRTMERLVDDLVGVLDAVGETGPVVLVGQSWGGPILRCFADRHPERTGGLVFVDGTVAELIKPAMIRINALSFRISSLIARLGGSGLVIRMALTHGWSTSISSADRAILERDYACPRAMRAGRREAAQMASARPLLERLQQSGTPDVPTICVQAGRVDRGMAKIRPLWNRTVARLMADAPRGRLEVVDDSGHLVPQEKPEVVHDAVLAVLDEVKEG